VYGSFFPFAVSFVLKLHSGSFRPGDIVTPLFLGEVNRPAEVLIHPFARYFFFSSTANNSSEDGEVKGIFFPVPPPLWISSFCFHPPRRLVCPLFRLLIQFIYIPISCSIFNRVICPWTLARFTFPPALLTLPPLRLCAFTLAPMAYRN